MKKEQTTTIIVFVICLLLAISNIANVAVIKRQNERIDSFKQEIEDIQNEKEAYRDEVKTLETELNKIKDEITGVKSQTDKVADKLIEMETREEAQEDLKVAIEEETTEEITTEYIPEKSIVVESTTTEEVVTKEVTTESEIIKDEPTEEIIVEDDIPWVVYQVVECEVHGADKESKMHVAHVIRNRVNSDLFPNNYYDVCTSPNQFCMRSDVEDSTIAAVKEAMQMPDTTDGALFFHSMGYMDSWGGYTYKFTDSAGHHFY